MFKNLNIIQIIGKIICFGLGLLCLYWSFRFITSNANFVDDLKIVTEKYEPADEGKMIIAKGNLHNDSIINDPKMNVTIEGISSMKRIVEMLQYRKKGEDSYSIDWASHQLASFAIDTDIGNKRFNNPTFPQDLQSHIFYGNATLGDTELSLTKDHFIYLNIDMRNLNREEEKNSEWIDYTNLSEDGGKNYGLTLSNGYYKSRPNGKAQIGDIRVSYKVQKIKGNPFITAIGIQNNGILSEYPYETEKDIAHAFYGDLSKEEIKKAIKGNNMQAFVPAFIIGLIFILIAIFAFNGEKAERKKLLPPKTMYD